MIQAQSLLAWVDVVVKTCWAPDLSLHAAVNLPCVVINCVHNNMNINKNYKHCYPKARRSRLTLASHSGRTGWKHSPAWLTQTLAAESIHRSAWMQIFQAVHEQTPPKIREHCCPQGIRRGNLSRASGLGSREQIEELWATDRDAKSKAVVRCHLHQLPKRQVDSSPNKVQRAR